MQFIIEVIRKVVILVLLMEIVLQMQSGKQYEAYIKMLVGIMVVYSLVSSIFGVFRELENGGLAPMQEFQWSGEWYADLDDQAKKQVGEVMEGQTKEKQENVQEKRISDIEVRIEIPSIAEVTIGEIGDNKE